MKGMAWLQVMLLVLLLLPGTLVIEGCRREGKSEPKTQGSPVPTSAQAEKQKREAPTEESEDEDEEQSTEFEIDGDANQYFSVAPMTVYFTLTAKNAKPPVKYNWDFGDGSPRATGKDQKHVYEKPGTYSAHVTATDASGAFDHITFILTAISQERRNKMLKQTGKKPKQQ